jgi:hypothetical protein
VNYEGEVEDSLENESCIEDSSGKRLLLASVENHDLVDLIQDVLDFEKSQDLEDLKSTCVVHENQTWKYSQEVDYKEVRHVIN